MSILILLTAALLPAILLWIYIIRQDPQPEPTSWLAKAVLYGVGICIPVAMFEMLIERVLLGGEPSTLIGTYDFGDLYAWGEITKKKDYSQGMYDSTDKPQSIITSVKNDVAKCIIGGNWATPTEKQFKELLSECQWEWAQIEGHYGFKIIGKNGNHIFLPAARWICSTKTDYQNKYGYYWTSERTTSNPQFARSSQFPRDGKGIIGNGYLYYGRSIRAVYVIAVAAE